MEISVDLPGTSDSALSTALGFEIVSMSFNAWPDKEVQHGKLVGRDAMLLPRPAALEPLVPTPASEVSAESLSRALSAAIDEH